MLRNIKKIIKQKQRESEKKLRPEVMCIILLSRVTKSIQGYTT